MAIPLTAAVMVTVALAIIWTLASLLFRGHIAAVLVGVLAVMLGQSPDFTHLPDSLRPNRPFWFSLFNNLMRPVNRDGIFMDLNAPSVIRAAEWVTGFSDWDDEAGTLRPALEHLTDSLKNDAELTALGRVNARMRLKRSLESRLRIVAWRKEHPEVEHQRIEAPVFILGFPRSGTTFLHKLMSLDRERFRAPLRWELVYPVPPPTPDETAAGRSHAPVKEAQGIVDNFMQLIPTLAASHTINALDPEECLPILDHELMSPQFYLLFNVSSYLEWLTRAPQAPALRRHRIFLQHLQSTGGGGTWLLKSPWHMNNVDAILATYPDARIVVPHRDPAGMIASISSLNAQFRGAGTDQIRVHEIAADQLRFWEAIAGRYLKARARHEAALAPGEPSPFVDIRFPELVKDPIATVGLIYKRLGFGAIPPAAERAMREFLGTSGRRGSHGRHVYELGWFGMDEDSIFANGSSFAAYCEQHGLQRKFKMGEEY